MPQTLYYESKVWHVGIQNLRLQMLNATVPPFFNLDPHSLRKGPKHGQKSKKNGERGEEGN